MSILVVAEHDNKALKKSTYHTLTAAQQLGLDIDILIIGYQCDTVTKEAATLEKIRTVFVANAKEYEHQLAENSAALIVNLATAYQYILSSANTFGKNLIPRVAALLNVNMIADVIKIMGPDTFIRPAYAGNVITTVKTTESIKLLTIREIAFPAISSGKITAPIQFIKDIIPNTLTTLVDKKASASTRPELTTARIIVAGGRGLKTAENFKLIEQLADHLGAAVGASRAAVDASFAPNDYQVGQTGKIVAPDLYIAIGISGAIQHVAGMKESKIIVAINNDPNAPIFEIADYGLVADLFTAISEWCTELSHSH